MIMYHFKEYDVIQKSHRQMREEGGSSNIYFTIQHYVVKLSMKGGLPGEDRVKNTPKIVYMIYG